jgi:hypothetical protein
MRRRHGKRARLGGALLAAIGALALLALPSVAAAKDRNHDRIPDRWEKLHHLSLKVDQAGRDQDRDGLRNRAEFRAGDNPRDRDTDNDGVMDGDENAGTIASFDKETGRLEINLFNGDTVAGTVDDRTRIECDQDENEMEHNGALSSHDGQDNSGPGSADDESGPSAGEDPDHSGPGPGDEGDYSGPGAGEEDHSGPGAGDDQNDNDDQNEDEHEAACTTDALVAGAVVEEAQLELRNGAAIFEEVELAG